MRKIQTIEAELIKASHNRMYLLCGILAFLLPILITVKDMNMPASSYILSMEEWLSVSRDLCISLVLPVLSGLILTQLFQKEYTERTILNQLTAPISRVDFLTGKLVVWAFFHLGMCLLSLLTTCAGALCLYKGQPDLSILYDTAWQFLFHGILTFLTLTPLMAAAVFQKNLFYPSVLLCLLFTLVAGSCYMLTGNLPFLLPWSAARILFLTTLTRSQILLCVSSIGICFFTGLFLSVIGFSHQNI